MSRNIQKLTHISIFYYWRINSFDSILNFLKLAKIYKRIMGIVIFGAVLVFHQRKYDD